MDNDNINKDRAQIINENHMENCNVFMGNIYGASFPLPGAHVTIEQHYGDGQKPTSNVPKGQVKSEENQEEKKIRVMKSITSLFDFSDQQLGRDNKNNRLTNDSIAILFRKCFGIGSHPTSEDRQIMEEMWTLLIDKRDKCAKQGGEEFFRQTVLNVIGYFKFCGLLAGTPLDLAKACFKDADANLAKNIERNITSNSFPKRMVDIIDFYIDELKDGKF